MLGSCCYGFLGMDLRVGPWTLWAFETSPHGKSEDARWSSHVLRKIYCADMLPLSTHRESNIEKAFT